MKKNLIITLALLGSASLLGFTVKEKATEQKPLTETKVEFTLGTSEKKGLQEVNEAKWD